MIFLQVVFFKKFSLNVPVSKMKGVHFHRHSALCVHCVCNLLNTNNFVTQYRMNKEKNVPVAFSFPLETIEISMVGKSHTEPKLYFTFIFPALLIQWDTKVLNAMKRSRGLTPLLIAFCYLFALNAKKHFWIMFDCKQ